MIVAGIGCRKGASRAQVLAALTEALTTAGVGASELGLTATGEIKRGEAGIAAAAQAMNTPLMILDDDRLRAVAARCLTVSTKSAETTGVPSLSEAAALAGAGAGGRLLGPRLDRDGVTCALAATAEHAP